MSFRILTTQAEFDRYVAPIQPAPKEGCAVAFAEFDGEECIAFQLIHNAIFAEGLWAKDGRAHLRTIWNQTIDYARELVGEGKEMLTMTRSDEQGLRIGRVIQRFGFVETPFRVYRRTL